MSKGLGKIQRKILELLRKKPQKWFAVTEVAIRCYHPERVDPKSDKITEWRCSALAKAATQQSIDKLYVAGFVETQIKTTTLHRRWKMVKIKW